MNRGVSRTINERLVEGINMYIRSLMLHLVGLKLTNGRCSTAERVCSLKTEKQT